MSDFFDVPVPPGAPREPPDFRPYDWSGPPENELGAVAATSVELARTETTVVAISSFTVYSTGLSFTLSVRHRQPIGHEPTHQARHPLDGPEALRFGLQLPDGRKATTTRRLRPGELPSPPYLALRGVLGRGGRGLEAGFWLWPLPPPGPLELVLAWPAQRIPLTRREIDPTPILEAATRVEQMWPDERPLPTGPWTQVVG